MIAQTHRPEHGSTTPATGNQASRRQWAPPHPVNPLTHPAYETVHTEWHLNGDRVGGLIAVSLFLAFVVFLLWVFSYGTPAGYDPMWDYMMWH